MSYFVDRCLYINYLELSNKFINDKQFTIFKNKFVVKEILVGKVKHFYKKTISAYTYSNINKVKYLVLPPIHINFLKKANIINNLIKESNFTPCLTIKNKRLKHIQELFDYQVSVVDYLASNFYNTMPNSCYLQMGTGLGKTKTACALLVRLKVKAIVVVPTKAIADQWVVDCGEMFPDIRVIKYSNSSMKEGIPEHDIIVCVVNTFRNKPPSFSDKYFIIFDEAHELCSKQNIKSLINTCGRPCLGLSASPLERPDGLDKAVELYLGNVVYTDLIPNINISATVFTGRVHKILYYGEQKYCEIQYNKDKDNNKTDNISCINTIKTVLNDPYRIKLIIRCIKRLMGDGHGIFIFAETRSYLKNLRLELVKEFGDSIEESITEEIEESITEESITEEIEESITEDEEPEENLELITNFDINEELFEREAKDYSSELLKIDDNIIKLSESNKWVEDSKVSLIMGGTTGDDMKKVKSKKSHIVLTSYGFGRRGISLVDMTAIIMASPRKHGLNQIIGRIMRRGSDQRIIREIYDIVDNRSMLKYQFKEREKVYTKREYPIIIDKYWWDQFK